MDLERTAANVIESAENQDWETWMSLVGEDVRFFIHPGEEMSRDVVLEMTQGMAASGIEISYSNVRRIVAADAVVEQHDTTFTVPSGEAITVEACVIFRFHDGQLRTVDEYVDMAALAPVLEAD